MVIILTIITTLIYIGLIIFIAFLCARPCETFKEFITQICILVLYSFGGGD